MMAPRLILGGFLLLAMPGWASEVPDPQFLGPWRPLPKGAEGASSDKEVEAPARPTIGRSPASSPERIRPSPWRIEFSPESVVEPNAQGVVRLVFGVKADPPALENPFDDRLPPPSAQPITLHVISLILGERACARINGIRVEVGERVEGFTVLLLENEAVFIERNGRVVRLPVGRSIRLEEVSL